MEKMTLVQVEKAVRGALSRESDGDIVITGVGIDSRRDLTRKLFVPLKGTQADGHAYIANAFENGAAAALSEHETDARGPVIRVADTAQALKDLAMAYKSLLPVKTVAITGSVGKTTTKDMIASVLSQKYETLKTEGNFNNEIGLPLTVFGLEARHQFAVLEMGMSGFGEIRSLSRIARPDVCVITNIGVSHIETLGSQAGVLKAKSEIFEYMNPVGSIILNGDDALLRGLAGLPGKPLYYGMGEENDVYACDIKPDGLEGVRFTIKSGGMRIPVDLPFPGAHMVQNALAAAAAGLLAGLSGQDIQNGIERFKPAKMRMNIEKTPTGTTIINDTYNASPHSVKAAIDILKQAKGRKVCILGDMLALGSYSAHMHAEIGRYAAQSGVDVMIFIGGHARAAYFEAMARKPKNSFYFETKQQLLQVVRCILKPGDTVLVKASRDMGFEEIVKVLQEVKV